MVNTQDLNPVALGGFFTVQLYLQGQKLAEIESRLGFDRSRLAQGAWFVTPIGLPGPNDFDLAGYSQVAGHRTREQYGELNSPVNDLEKAAYLQKKKNAMATWALHGQKRLIKVIPMTGHSLNMSDNYQYPPGSGIPQWRISRAKETILWRGICFVKDYPNGRFIPDEGYTAI